ncbi:hypothetical protein ACX80O_16025 [Arthrobacter sp. Hz1]
MRNRSPTPRPGNGVGADGFLVARGSGSHTDTHADTCAACT